MKTLLAALTIGLLITPTPTVVKERLIGFDFYAGDVISLAWDLDNDKEEDLRVFYQFKKEGNGALTLRPFSYFHDLNFDGRYDKSEMFKTSSDDWKRVTKEW